METPIITEYGHQYVYSDVLHYFLYVPEKMKIAMRGSGHNVVGATDYYMRKFNFLREYHFFDTEEIAFQTDCTEDLVKQNMACLRQLLIEVTDKCNLKCKYCGYGEFYSNYDRRETCNQTFDNVKVLIDYLTNLWRSDYNVSHNNTVTVGFCGGEPLLNMKLIQETIAYMESLHIDNLRFSYNMTTNAMLLGRYMDYLVEKDFTLLISLDGDEYQSGYRVDKHGKSSFTHVVGNIQKLKDTYPEFFEKNVHFNAVLHDRNSVEGCYKSIHGLFGKRPRVSELNTNGIIPERVEEFVRMFNDKTESFKTALTHDPDIKDDFEMEDDASLAYHFMIMNYGGNRYSDYVDLFDSDRNGKYVPTGTCRPFERKLFLTVNGKILPCERIGQECAIARLSDGKLNLDCSAVAKYYSSLYKKIIKSCVHCNLKKSCGQCLFLLKEKNGQLICPGIETDAKLREKFSAFLTYAESNPGDYERLLSSIIVA